MNPVKEVRLIMMLSVLIVTATAVAQTAATDTGTDTDIALLRSDVQAQRTDVVAHTMQLSDADAKNFWPLYREYVGKEQAIGDQRVSAIKDYAGQYDTMNDAQADGLADRMLNFDKSRTQLRAEYYPKFKKAIGAKQAAKFLQVDNRLNLLVDLQIANAVPIIQ
jgi:Spy/CpxP family protein refolding chaperone